MFSFLFFLLVLWSLYAAHVFIHAFLPLMGNIGMNRGRMYVCVCVKADLLHCANFREKVLI